MDTNEQLPKQSDDWEGHPNPERLITIEVTSSDSIFSKLVEAQATSISNDGVGVELNFRGGFNVAMVYPDSNLLDLHQAYLRNKELVCESQRHVGELALRHLPKGAAPIDYRMTA